MNQVDLDQLAVVIGRAIAKHRVASGFTQEQVPRRWVSETRLSHAWSADW